MSAATAPVLAAAGSIRLVPRRCVCDWDPPDWRYPPHRRVWTLTVISPSCAVHGNPVAGSSTGGPA